MNDMKSQFISLDDLLNLSEDFEIYFHCYHCEKGVYHKRVRWIVTGLPESEYVEDNNGKFIEIKVSQLADSCIVQCLTCGEMSIAKWMSGAFNEDVLKDI